MEAIPVCTDPQAKFLSSCVYPRLSANVITRFLLCAQLRYAPPLQWRKWFSPQVPRATEMITILPRDAMQARPIPSCRAMVAKPNGHVSCVMGHGSIFVWVSSGSRVTACSGHAMSVRASVRLSRSGILSKRINISSIFSPLGSNTILVFPHQTPWR